MENWPAQSLYNLSLDYMQGKRVPKDLKKSFELNEQAARQGHHEAILAMGWYYIGGRGVAMDYEKARTWYRKSARHGQTMAMFSLGQLAYIQQDYSESVIWFKRASEAGHARSFYWLGKCHWHGRGVLQDKSAAMSLFHQAANKKVDEARRALKFLTRNKRC